jgi:hypothetical protein
MRPSEIKIYIGRTPYCYFAHLIDDTLVCATGVTAKECVENLMMEVIIRDELDEAEAQVTLNKILTNNNINPIE